MRAPYFQHSNLSDERAEQRGLTEQLCVPLHTHNSGHMTTRRWCGGRGTMRERCGLLPTAEGCWSALREMKGVRVHTCMDAHVFPCSV